MKPTLTSVKWLVCRRTNEGAEHLRQRHAQVSPTHTHLWLSPQGFVRGRLLDGVDGGVDGGGQERVRHTEVKETQESEASSVEVGRGDTVTMCMNGRWWWWGGHPALFHLINE